MATTNVLSVASLLKCGKLFQSSGKVKQAIAIYKACIEKCPSDYRAWFNISFLLSHRYDSLEYLCKALALSPTDRVADICGALSAFFVKTTGYAHHAVALGFIGLENDVSNSDCMCNINLGLRMIGRIEQAISLSWRFIKCGILTDDDNYQFSTVDSKDPIALLHSTPKRYVVVCVKWGTKYGPEYVNNLYRAILSSLSPRIRDALTFLCLTDDAYNVADGIVCSTFPAEAEPWKHWWLKACIFDAVSSFQSHHVVYLDLDTVVMGNLDFLFEIDLSGEDGSSPRLPLLYTLAAAHMRNEGRSCGLNSSVMVWRSGEFRDIFTYLGDGEHYAAITRCTHKFDHFLEMYLWRRAQIQRRLERHRREGSSDLGDSSCQDDVGGADVPGAVYLQNLYPGKIVEYNTLLHSRRQCDTAPADVAPISSSNDHDDIFGGDFTFFRDEHKRSLDDIEDCRWRAVEIVNDVLSQWQISDTVGCDEKLRSRAEECGAVEVDPANSNASRLEGRSGSIPSDSVALVCFPLRPKPHEDDVAEWARQAWTGC